MRLALLLWATLLAATSPKVTISVTPRVMLPGATVRVTCRVPRDERNRWLTVGIVNYGSSLIQLDGAEAVVTHARIYGHVPCGTEAAFCLLVDREGRQTTVTSELVVSGCD